MQLKIDALPKGVSAAPIKPLPADQTAFQIELKVDAKAAPLKAEATFSATATIAAMPYNHPQQKLTLEIAK
ncbi:MAG: hypothetical protein U0793_32445 [Gemmataceae bacterium]